MAESFQQANLIRLGKFLLGCMIVVRIFAAIFGGKHGR